MYICTYLQIFHNEIVGKRTFLVNTETNAYRLINFWHCCDTNWKYVISEVGPYSEQVLIDNSEWLEEYGIRYLPLKTM